MILSFNKIIIALLSFSLFGCGGSDDSGVTEGKTPPKKVSISAQDALKFTQLNTKTTIDLRQRVQAQNNESLLLSDVKSINGDCDILSIDGLSFDIYSRNADVCRFEYNVTPASDNYTGSAKAVAQIVVNEESTQGQYLPPISRAIQKNESVSFNTSDLGIEAGYILDPQSVVVLNGTGIDEIGDLANISESGFDYTAPNTETIVRIFYSVINKTDNIVKPGIIYIAIGQNINISPNAQDRTIEPGTLLYEERTINIEDLVSDTDGDELQLVYARGVIGYIDISGNLEFKYKSSSTGHEYVTYIVSDHNGGYGIGLLDFTISTYPFITDTTQQLLFLPPMTMASTELALSSGSYYESGSNGYQGFYPIFTHSLASSYCTTQGGRLPTEAELITMWKNVINKPVFQSKFKWHSSLPYLTNIESKQVSLIDGKERSSIEPTYFSCVISTKEPEWEFRESFIQTNLDAITKIIEVAYLSNGQMVYRDQKDYKLKAKTQKYLKNGQVADSGDVSIEIDGNILNIHVEDATPDDTVYIQAQVTDDEITQSSMIITVGFTQCKKNTKPEEALEEGCIYTVGFNDDTQRFTLAIPTNVIGVPPEEQVQRTKTFGSDGVSFIGAQNPNTQAWHDYLGVVCRTMNKLELDGRTNWTAGISMPQNTLLQVKRIKDEDFEATLLWVSFIQAIDNGMDPMAYGQGFAGLPGTKFVINQEGAKDTYHRQVINFNGTYTFASCVSPK